MFNNIHALTQMMIENHLVENSLVIDATIGNGKDALKMMSQLGPDGFLYGFDIQEDALVSAKTLLDSEGYHNYELILDGHQNMDHYVKPATADLIMFNLGYLPKGNKTLTTKLETTLKAIKASLSLLKLGGFLLIACYPGHPEGMEEYLGLNEHLKTLCQKTYNVFHGNFINQKNHPPVVFIIQKKI